MPGASRPIAVLFDLDGTLIDSIGLLLACVHHAFADFPGRRPTDEEWVAGIGTPLWSQMAAYTDSEEQVRELTNRYRSFQRERHDELTALYPGTLDVVRELAERGHPMAIVTSKSNEMMHRALQHTGIAQYMTAAIGADSCTAHKPDPFPVRLALHELDRGAHEAVFVGDSPHDMNAGNAAGVATVAALWGPFTRDQLRPSNPSFWLDGIAGLAPIVREVQQRVELGAPA